MSESMFLHDFHHDEVSPETSYPISDVQYVYINDINQGNYSTGFVNFTNVSVIGSNFEKQYAWSQGYLQVPFQVDLDLTQAAGGTAAFDPNFSYAGAISCKGSHHLIDWTSVKFNGVSCNRNTYYNNLIVNEQLKKLTNDEYKLQADLLGHAWDEGRFIDYSAALGEINNRVAQPADFASVFKPSSQQNTGHVERMKKTNVDISSVANSSVSKFTGQTTALLQNVQQMGVYQVTASKVVLCGMANIPLKYVHSFFEAMPTVASSVGFELRTQMNVAQENSYTVTYDAAGVPTAVSSSQIIGHSCPFLLSQVSADGLRGIKVANAAAAFSIRMSSRIGWGVSQAPPCRIHLPSINYTTEYLSKIVKQPSFRLKYNDFYVDVDSNKVPNSQIQRLFNVQLSRVRTLYIIPLLSATANYPSALTSPLSSAPNTCTPCRLKNFNIQIGGQNIFIEPQSFPHQFYNNSLYSLLGEEANGNSFKSKMASGQITKSMWENGYNVYTINMKKTSDESSDNIAKSFQLTYQVEGGVSNLDFIYVMDYEVQMLLDRGSGEITNA